jgi:hypothetical protein
MTISAELIVSGASLPACGASEVTPDAALACVSHEVAWCSPTAVGIGIATCFLPRKAAAGPVGGEAVVDSSGNTVVDSAGNTVVS